MKPGTSKRGPKRRGTKKGGPTKIGTTKRRRIHKTGRRRSMHKKMIGGVNDEKTKTMLIDNIVSTVMLFVKVETDSKKKELIEQNVLMGLNAVYDDVKKYDFTPPLVTDREQFNKLGNSEKTKIWVALFWKSFRDSEQLYKETIKHIVVPSNITDIKIFENNPNSRSWERPSEFSSVWSGTITVTQKSTWSSAAHTNINIDKLIELFLNIYKNVDTYVITDEFKVLNLSPYDTEMQADGVGEKELYRDPLLGIPVSDEDLFRPPMELKPSPGDLSLAPAPAPAPANVGKYDHIRDPDPLKFHIKEDDDESEGESEGEHEGNGADVKESELPVQSEGNSTNAYRRERINVIVHQNPEHNVPVTFHKKKKKSNTKAYATSNSDNNWGLYLDETSGNYYWYSNILDVSAWIRPPDNTGNWVVLYYGPFDSGNHWYNTKDRRTKHIFPPKN